MKWNIPPTIKKHQTNLTNQSKYTNIAKVNETFNLAIKYIWSAFINMEKKKLLQMHRKSCDFFFKLNRRKFNRSSLRDKLQKLNHSPNKWQIPFCFFLCFSVVVLQTYIVQSLYHLIIKALIFSWLL